METVHISESNSPIGRLRVASTDQGLAFVELPHPSGAGLHDWLERYAPQAHCVEAEEPNREAIKQILEYLDSRRMKFDVPLDLRGTSFQLKVWAKLCEIPYGESRSYKEVADALRQPGAQRAVGSANNANPVSLIVPCHRVIGADGSLGGYGGGVKIKARLLAMERSSRPLSGQLL